MTTMFGRPDASCDATNGSASQSGMRFIVNSPRRLSRPPDYNYRAPTTDAIDARLS